MSVLLSLLIGLLVLVMSSMCRWMGRVDEFMRWVIGVVMCWCKG